ncbi:MAG: MazG nucleotide pyrophosphohydrolase domain-containing protein [Nanoarchaeota archaeon]
MDKFECDEKTLNGLREFQKDIALTHAKLSIEKAISWFSEEVEELKEGIEKKDNQNIKEELAQCLIWCFSIANSLDIDISKIVEDKINLHLKKYPEHYQKSLSR